MLDLIEIAKSSKAAAELAKGCGKYLGLKSESERMREKAQAQADAKIIAAKADAEVKRIQGMSELEQRGRDSLLAQGAERQENRDNVFKAAVKELPPDVNIKNIQNMDKDKTAYIFREGEIVSDKEMLLLWGKILAREAATPGNISRKTISIVSQMDKQDADKFTYFGQFVWDSVHPGLSEKMRPFIYEYESDIYNNKQYHIFSLMKHLESMGLVSYELKGHSFFQSLSDFVLSYHNRPVYLKLLPDFVQTKKGFSISIGHALLTQSGRELFPICGANRNDEFFNYIIEKWKKDGLNPSLTPHPEN